MEVSDEDDWSDGWSEESRAFLDSLKRGDYLNDNFLKGVGHFMTERNEILRSENHRLQSELDALRGEVERLNGTLDTALSLSEATIAQLRDRVAGLEEGLREYQFAEEIDDPALRQSELAVARSNVSALLTQNEVG